MLSLLHISFTVTLDNTALNVYILTHCSTQVVI